MPPPIKNLPIPGKKHTAFEAIPKVDDAPASDDIIEATLILRRRPGSSELPSLEEMSDLLPCERKYLTHADFETTYGADPADVAKVEDFAQQHNLGVVEASIPRRTIRLAGTIQAFTTAFDVELAHYQLHTGIHRGHEEWIPIPAELKPIVEWIFGLENRPIGKHVHRYGPFNRPAGEQLEKGPRPDAGFYMVPGVAKLYNFPNFSEGNGLGQCIGHIELYGGYNPADIKTYFTGLLGIPTPEIVHFGENQPGKDETGDFAVTVHLETVGSVAPKARIAIYFSGITSPQDLTFQIWYNTISTAIHDKVYKPQILLIAWVDLEKISWTQEEVALINALFYEAALLGITICAASGDSGSTFPEAQGPFSALPTVSFPASSPYALSCGGTELIARNDTITREVVWNNLADTLTFITQHQRLPPGNGGASSGGVSVLNELPAYQQQAQVPEATSYDYNMDTGRLELRPPFRGRGVPDVAANAALNTTYQFRFKGNWTSSGGTSVSTPLWAGLVALINQGLGCPAGYFHPVLYRLQLGDNPHLLRTITEGSNGGYEAHPDRPWNPCTGLGSPHGTNLLKALRGQ